MARKGSLVAGMQAAKEKMEAKTASVVNRASDEMVTTAIHVRKETLILLRRVAVERANIHGGRPSVSAVITELVEANRAELEREAATRN